MKVQRILVPVDFSENSLSALKYAIELAREHESEVVIAHVVEPLPRGTASWSDATTLLEQYGDKASSELKRFEEKARQLYRKCRSELYFGVPHEVIAEAASKIEVDLIVISTSGRAPLLDLLIGGTASQLLRRAPCPVLRLLTI